jgi:hypothetical protein
VAIVQLSRITNRRGLQQDLPQLAPGELGWCVNTRLLFIGNGDLQEGSPAIGNTEVLTEFSDIKRLVEQLDGPLQISLAGTLTLLDNQPNPVDSGLSFPASARSAIMDYQIVRAGRTRVGTMTVSFDADGNVWQDDYSEFNDLGVSIEPTLSLGTNRIFYITTSTGFNAEFRAGIRYFN